MRTAVVTAIVALACAISLAAAPPADAASLGTADMGLIWPCNGWCAGQPTQDTQWALAFTLVNAAEILQQNLCVGCASVVQANLAQVTQLISNALSLFDTPLEADSVLSGSIISQQVNLAQIFQVNLCVDCIDVTQLNFASIVQVNDTWFAPASSPQPVPEPATVGLTVAGLVTLVLARRLASASIAA